MAQTFENAVLTNDGIALLTRVQANECSMTFTRVVLGSGSYTSEAEKETSVLQLMTQLESEEQEADVTSCEVKSETAVKVTATITNEGVSTGYYWNEVGIYAKASDQATDILYAIAVTSAGEEESWHGDYIPAYDSLTPVTIIQAFVLSVGNSAHVSVTVNGPNVIVDSETHIVYSLTVTDGQLILNSAEASVPDINISQLITDLMENIVTKKGGCLFGDDSGNALTDDDGNAVVADWTLVEA